MSPHPMIFVIDISRLHSPRFTIFRYENIVILRIRFFEKMHVHIFILK